MSGVGDHLRGVQFPDDPPITAEDLKKPGMSLARFTGGWVGAGQPRWKGYAIYVTSFIAGILMLIPLPGEQQSFFTIIGVGLLAFGIFGSVETATGRRFWRPR